MVTDDPSAKGQSLPDRNQLRASNDDREHFAQILHRAMGEGRITVDELEERLGTVYAAKTLGELQPVIADLPGASAALAPSAAHQVSAPGPAPSSALIGGKPGSTSSVAMLSGASRKGNWVVPAQHNTFAFWGGVDIDLRNARFAQQHTTITAVAIMGGVDIVVPDDIEVDVTGIGIMGAFESTDRSKNTAPPPPGAPVLKVTGFAFWGGVNVIRKPRKDSTEQIER